MKKNDLDEILSLVSQAKSDLYKKVGDENAAAKELVRSARLLLSAALGAARKENYRESLRLFEALQKNLQEGKLLASEWAEIYLVQAICHARLGQKREMAAAWGKAQTLEPDNEILKQTAKRLGLVKK
jgi:hypothetical protein